MPRIAGARRATACIWTRGSKRFHAGEEQEIDGIVRPGPGVNTILAIGPNEWLRETLLPEWKVEDEVDSQFLIPFGSF
jgi:hypothetical protein